MFQLYIPNQLVNMETLEDSHIPGWNKWNMRNSTPQTFFSRELLEGEGSIEWNVMIDAIGARDETVFPFLIGVTDNATNTFAHMDFTSLPGGFGVDHTGKLRSRNQRPLQTNLVFERESFQWMIKIHLEADANSGCTLSCTVGDEDTITLFDNIPFGRPYCMALHFPEPCAAWLHCPGLDEPEQKFDESAIDRFAFCGPLVYIDENTVSQKSTQYHAALSEHGYDAGHAVWHVKSNSPVGITRVPDGADWMEEWLRDTAFFGTRDGDFAVMPKLGKLKTNKRTTWSFCPPGEERFIHLDLNSHEFWIADENGVPVSEKKNVPPGKYHLMVSFRDAANGRAEIINAQWNGVDVDERWHLHGQTVCVQSGGKFCEEILQHYEDVSIAVGAKEVSQGSHTWHIEGLTAGITQIGITGQNGSFSVNLQGTGRLKWSGDYGQRRSTVVGVSHGKNDRREVKSRSYTDRLDSMQAIVSVTYNADEGTVWFALDGKPCSDEPAFTGLPANIPCRLHVVSSYFSLETLRIVDSASKVLDDEAKAIEEIAEAEIDETKTTRVAHVPCEVSPQAREEEERHSPTPPQNLVAEIEELKEQVEEVYSYAEMSDPSKWKLLLSRGLVAGKRETYLTDEEFQSVMGMTKTEFNVLKPFKQKRLKQQNKLW